MTGLDGLYAFAEARGIEVDRFPLPHGEALSMPLPGGRYGVALDPDKLRGERDEKVKLGHELGHCVTGSFYNRYALCDVRKKYENRADKWAIRRLVPKQELLRAVRKGYTQPWELAEYFDLPQSFMEKVMSFWKEAGQ